VIRIDHRKLAGDITRSVRKIREQTGSMAGVRLNPEMEEESYLDAFRQKSGMEKMAMLAGMREHRRMAGSAQIDHLVERITNSGNYRVYVTAFISSNPFAYLKAGRLLTSRQPSFEVDSSAVFNEQLLCSVESGEALALADFVFLASLPKSVLNSGKLLKGISPEPLSPPVLVNFPFRRERSSLTSLIGRFSISSRLVHTPQPAGKD
jgi:hypothetical protein